jgi:hypothetical protein
MKSSEFFALLAVIYMAPHISFAYSFGWAIFFVVISLSYMFVKGD